MSLKAPFPYFGGKRRVADQVWQRLGDVDHYIEPFCGSAAVLLARPGGRPDTAETINDASGYVTNFWRAVKQAPGELADRCKWPVNETDMLARRDWLQERGETLAEDLRDDPEFCDPKAAAWWCWGACVWIGSGWPADDADQMPRISHNGGRGVTSTTHRERLDALFANLHDRLRHVRVLCGGWQRALKSEHTMTLCGSGTPVGVFLDPPYPNDWGGSTVYAHDSDSVAAEVFEWCRTHGDDERLRIAVCGYEGAWTPPDGWGTIAWKARGGYGVRNDDNANATRERVWVSPHCRGEVQPGLFG